MRVRQGLPDPLVWRDGMQLRPDDVGLRADRPFRFCTLHYGPAPQPPVLFGDDPHPTVTRTLELFVVNRSGERRVPLHGHQFYEVMVVHEGTATHVVGDEMTPLSRGEIVVMAPGAVHAYEDIDRLVKTNLYIQPEWFFDELRMLWWEEGLVRHLLATALFDLPQEMRWFRLRAEGDMMARCERELEDMRVEARRSRPSLLVFHAGFLKILTLLNTAFTDSFKIAQPPLAAAVWQSVQYMERCIAQGLPFSVKDMSAQLGVSANHLTRIFTEATGQAPSDYFQHRRVQHALRMLLEPGRSITDIAHHLGYADSAHFSRSFRKATGESPRAYRQNRLA